MTRRASDGLPWGAGAAAAAGLLWAAGWMTFTLRDSATAGGPEPERMPTLAMPAETPAATSKPLSPRRKPVALSRLSSKPRIVNPPIASGPIQQVGGYSQYKKSPLGCPSCIAREKALKERKAMRDQGKLNGSPAHAGESEVGSSPEPMPSVDSSPAAPQAAANTQPETQPSAPPVEPRKPARQNAAPRVAPKEERHAPRIAAAPAAVEAPSIPDLEVVTPAPMTPGRAAVSDDEFDSSDAAPAQPPAAVSAVAGKRPGIQSIPSEFFTDEAAADASGADTTFSDRQTETGERRLSPVELELQRRFEKDGREAPSLRFEDMPSMAEEGVVPEYMPPPALQQPQRRGFMDNIPFVNGGMQPNVSRGLAGQPPAYTPPPPQQPKPSFFKRLVPGFLRRESSAPESTPVQRQMAAEPAYQQPGQLRAGQAQPGYQQPAYQQPAARQKTHQPAAVAQPSRMPTMEEWRPGMPIPGQQPAKPLFRLPGFMSRKQAQPSAPQTVSSTNRVPELMTVPNEAGPDAQPEAMPAQLNNTLPPNEAPTNNAPPPQIIAQPSVVRPNTVQPKTAQPVETQPGAVAANPAPPQTAADGYDSELNIGDDSILSGGSAKPRLHEGAQPQPVLDARRGGVFLDSAAADNAAPEKLASDASTMDSATTASKDAAAVTKPTDSVAEAAGAAAARGLAPEIAAPTPTVIESPFTGLKLDVGEAETRIASPVIKSLEAEQRPQEEPATRNPLTSASPEVKIDEFKPTETSTIKSSESVATLSKPTEPAAAADTIPTESAKTPLETTSPADAIAATPTNPSTPATTPTVSTETTAKPSDDRDPVVQRAKLAARHGLRGFKGFCPVVLRNERRLVDAVPQFRAERRNRTYFFSSAAAVAEFELDAEKFIPVADGLDVIRYIADEPAAEGSLDHAVWYKGRLFLFSSAGTRGAFIRSPHAFDVKLEEKLASKMVAPVVPLTTPSPKVADVPKDAVNAGVSTAPANSEAAKSDANKSDSAKPAESAASAPATPTAAAPEPLSSKSETPTATNPPVSTPAPLNVPAPAPLNVPVKPDANEQPKVELTPPAVSSRPVIAPPVNTPSAANP